MKLAVLLAVLVSTIPPVPLIEQTKSGQAVNFDLYFENPSDTKLTIEKIEATLLDANGTMILQRRLESNGASILTLPNRELAPHGKLVVFNPFHEFEPDVALHRIRYDVTFDNEQRVSITVAPRPYTTRAQLILPMRGRVFVHDGHDFYSHHRRLDITGGMTTALNIRTNMTRYGYDFTIVDEQGRMHRGDGETNEEWFGFGQPVYAPADGVVVKAAGDRPDGSKAKRAPLDREAVMKDVQVIFGNYAVIDHGHGEFSLLAHMKQGSVTVRPGDRVKRGQQIGAVGCSGDAMFPHLHYQLQSDAALGEGLPSYFVDYTRYTGRKSTRVKRGQVDTGDVVISRR